MTLMQQIFSKMSFSYRRKYIIVALILFVCFSLKLFVNYLEMDFQQKNSILYELSQLSYQKRNASNCIISDYDPFDASIKRYITKWPAIDCGTPQLPLTYLDNNGFIKVNMSAVKKSKIPRNSIHCIYQEVLRPRKDDSHFKLGDPKYLLKKAKINASSVVVQCFGKNKLIYESSHLQVLPLEPELDRKSKKALKVHGINVLIFCIDSISRLNFIRQLPKTYNLITQEFKFDVLKGLTKGYVTMCLEDSTKTSLFNFHTGGFIQPPTNYYTRPFWLALEKQTEIVSSDKRCKGHVPQHQFFMKYYDQFVNKMQQGRNAFFSFGLLDKLSHNKLNSVQVLDDELAAFVTRLNTSGVLENTFILLLGDHGHRFADIRQTKIGRIEENMPFLGIHLPESLKHLRENIRFGYHGLSLFRPISADRTCSEIGIPQKYCICSQEKELDLDDPRVLDSAHLLMDHVNQLLKPHANLCAELTLDTVISSQLLIPYDYSYNTKPSDSETQVRVLVSAVPSGAMLEGLVVLKTGSSKIEGEVNRINEYGKQSACIDDTYVTAQMYCFCKH
ncbi:hypothetical protein B566_EDAN007556 [Ephemera danica]|nr:hypothetical protein B566_EDAN007556 [Ephemera danica]